MSSPTTIKATVYNSTNRSANVAINGGATFSVNEMAKSIQTFQTNGSTVGNFNVGSNNMAVQIEDNFANQYDFDISTAANVVSLEVYIFFYDHSQQVAGLIVTCSGNPASSGLLAVVPPVAS